MQNVIQENIRYTSQWWKNNLFGIKDLLYSERIHYYHLLNFIKRLEPSSLAHSILADIGFGTGACIKFLSKKYKMETIGLDIIPQTVSLYNRKVKKKRIKSSALQFDPFTNKTPFKDGQIDFVICSHVLEHVPDDEFLLQEIYRILKNDGIAYFAVPINEERFPVPNHIRKYTPAIVKQRLEKSGFQLLSARGSDNFSNFITAWALKRTFVTNVLKKSLIFLLSILPLSLLESFKLEKAQYVVIVKK